VKKLSDRRKCKFKEMIISFISKLLDEEEDEDHASNNACRFQHSSTPDTLQQANAACTTGLQSLSARKLLIRK
jgi:hypothetical protein